MSFSPCWLGRASVLMAVGGLFASASEAGRPLSTDDAATAGASTCQVESWFQRAEGAREVVLAPACGVGESVEVGLEWRSLGGDAGSGRMLSIGVKWVDPAWQWGPARFGIKAYGGRDRAQGEGWHTANRGLVGLLSLELSAQWQLHLNFGEEYVHVPRQHQAHGHAALTWVPSEDWMLFGEALATRGQGGALQSLGLRRWILADRLGLDLTRGRVAGQSGSGFWTAGVGWYGIGL